MLSKCLSNKEEISPEEVLFVVQDIQHTLQTLDVLEFLATIPVMKESQLEKNIADYQKKYLNFRKNILDIFNNFIKKNLEIESLLYNLSNHPELTKLVQFDSEIKEGRTYSNDSLFILRMLEFYRGYYFNTIQGLTLTIEFLTYFINDQEILNNISKIQRKIEQAVNKEFKNRNMLNEKKKKFN